MHYSLLTNQETTNLVFLTFVESNSTKATKANIFPQNLEIEFKIDAGQ